MPGGLLDGDYSLVNAFLLVFLAQVPLLDPAVAVAVNVVTLGHDLGPQRRVVLQRQSAHVERALDVVLFEDPEESPDTGPAAVFPLCLGLQAARLTWLAGRDLACRLVRVVAIQRRALRALLIVHDHRNGDPRTIRPLHTRCLFSVSDEIAFHMPSPFRNSSAAYNATAYSGAKNRSIVGAFKPHGTPYVQRLKRYAG